MTSESAHLAIVSLTGAPLHPHAVDSGGPARGGGTRVTQVSGHLHNRALRDMAIDSFLGQTRCLRCAVYP